MFHVWIAITGLKGSGHAIDQNNIIDKKRVQIEVRPPVNNMAGSGKYKSISNK